MNCRQSIRLTPHRVCGGRSLLPVLVSLSVALAVLVVASLVLASPASAAPEPDQQQTTLETDVVLAIGAGFESQQVLGQVVRSGIAGVLTQIDLPVDCGTSSPLVLQIVESAGSPGATVLATQTFSDLPPPTMGWRSFVLAGRPFVPAESLFGIVLSSPGRCVISFGRGDPYPRALGWYQNQSNPGIWGPIGGDVGFKTYVERMCKVPSLLELVQQEAQALIGAYGCVAGNVTYAYSDTVDEGQTISQAQAEGTLLPPRSAVDFVVSRGLPPCKVPNVRGQKLAVAKASIKKARCTVGRISRKPSKRVQKGRVLSQSPRAGVTVASGGKVKLVVSKGRPR